MKLILLVCALISLTAAAVLPEDAQAVITHYEDTNDGSGNYRFSFGTSNGIFRDEVGYLVNVGTPEEHIVVEGSYTYTDPEGKIVTSKYIADENGYREITGTTPRPAAGVPPSIVATLLGKK